MIGLLMIMRSYYYWLLCLYNLVLYLVLYSVLYLVLYSVELLYLKQWNNYY